MFFDERDKANILDHLWDNALIGIALVNEESYFLKANRTFCRITEYNEAELKVRTFQQITHPDDLDGDVAMAEDVKNEVVDQYDMKKRYITKTGKVVWINLRVLPYVRNDNFKMFISQISTIDPRSPVDMLEHQRRAMFSPIRETVRFIKKQWMAIGSFIGMLIVAFNELL